MDEVSLADRLARIEAKLEELCRLNENRGEDHENRIRSLEKWKYGLPAALATAAFSAALQIWGGR